MRLTPELEAYIKQNGARDVKKCPADVRWSLSKEFNKMKASDMYFLASMKRLMELGMIYGQPQATKEDIKASKFTSDTDLETLERYCRLSFDQPKTQEEAKIKALFNENREGLRYNKDQTRSVVLAMCVCRPNLRVGSLYDSAEPKCGLKEVLMFMVVSELT